MASSRLVPKQRSLNENESFASFEAWRESLVFHIVLDNKFARFIGDLKNWSAYKIENRGFTDDGSDIAVETRMTAQVKSATLQVVLGAVASYAPVINHKYITQQAKSLDEIFERLRAHYGFRKTGSRITEALEFKLESMETRESLWERVYGFMENNLLSPVSGVRHDGEDVTEHEEFSPTLLNLTVVIWLNAIHPGLPAIIKQRFATNLRDVTIYSIRNEISDSVPSLLQELNEREGTVSFTKYNPGRKTKYTPGKYRYGQKQRSKCCLCEAASRPGADTHFLSACPFLPAEDKKYIGRAKIREVEAESDSDSESDLAECSHTVVTKPPKMEASTCRVDIISSPCLQVEIHGKSTHFTLDTGAESNLILLNECQRMGIKVQPTVQRANMADGISPMETVGEVHFTATRRCDTTNSTHQFLFSGLVVKTLNCSVLAGMPFLERNDIFIRPKHKSIYLGDCCTVKYVGGKGVHNNIRAASILRVPRQVCILPGASIRLEVPKEFMASEIALEPRYDCPSMQQTPDWLGCKMIQLEDEFVDISNESSSPVLVKRHEQLCQVRQATEMITQPEVSLPKPLLNSQDTEADFSSLVIVDPAQVLNDQDREEFKLVNRKHKEVFSATLGRYNGASGSFKHIINMSSSLPPQRKGKIPMYNRSNLEVLQGKFDELYLQGVFARPEEVGVAVEYVSPSFLIAKSTGGHRLVTSFTEIGQYAKPQPSLLPNVEDVLRQIGQWKWIVKADLKQAYYQIPLAKESMKLVGVCTPFRGIFVYQRAVMGLPGSESALEELLCRVLGDMMVGGGVVKLADDLYCGSDQPCNLLVIWDKVLQLLQDNGLRLSPQKTVCCPMATEILGWHWEQGRISATPHRLNALAACSPPKTVKGLRSFIGAYKFLCKVLPRHSDVLQPLDKLSAAGKQSCDKIVWTTELETAFSHAKEHLKDAKVLTLPRKEDKLQIITDAAAGTSGLASAMYVIRGKPYLAGIFNARKKGDQIGWLPCEIEALSIAAGVKHFSPYIVQSAHTTSVLTDSKPCVQAYKKLQRGMFSASPRVTTFLAVISRFQVTLAHIAGKENVFSDFISRNPLSCDGNCQVCQFVNKMENSVVHQVSVGDVISGRCSVPYTTRSTWLQTQQECPDLCLVRKYLVDGRGPSRKKRGINEVRRYLNSVKLSKAPSDGLLIVPHEEAFRNTKQRIVVPRDVVDGLLTALHLQLQHPSKYQLRQVFIRGFFALDLDKAIDRTTNGCHTCASLRTIPTRFREQTTSQPPERIGCRFSADVIRRERQFIFIMREDVSAFTETVFISDESAQSLKDGLVRLSTKFRPPSGPTITVRVDAATGFQAIKENTYMKSIGIVLELGNVKNVNKNPVAEKGISEFHGEVVRLKPNGGQLTDVDLALATANLNSRIRQGGLSAVEIWTQRDMQTREQLPIDDCVMIRNKFEGRTRQHLASAKWKARGLMQEEHKQLHIGDVVYLLQDRDKRKCREKYIIVEMGANFMCTVKKFSGQQFRGKRYVVRNSDIIKVHPHVFEAAENSSDSEGDVLVGPPVDAVLEDSSDGSSGDNVDRAAEPVITEPDQVRRSRRARRLPSHLDGFIMDQTA